MSNIVSLRSPSAGDPDSSGRVSPAFVAACERLAKRGLWEVEACFSGMLDGTPVPVCLMRVPRAQRAWHIADTDFLWLWLVERPKSVRVMVAEYGVKDQPPAPPETFDELVADEDRGYPMLAGLPERIVHARCVEWVDRHAHNRYDALENAYRDRRQAAATLRGFAPVLREQGFTVSLTPSGELLATSPDSQMRLQLSATGAARVFVKSPMDLRSADLLARFHHVVGRAVALQEELSQLPDPQNPDAAHPLDKAG